MNSRKYSWKCLIWAIPLIFASTNLMAAPKKKKVRSNPTKEAGRIFEKALKFQRAGDLQEAKRLYIKIGKNYPKTPLNDEHESDVESYEIPNVLTYGEYSTYQLQFIELEIKEGSKRTYKTIEEAVADLIKEVKAEDKTEIEKSLWVEVEMRQCESHGPSKLPAEAAEELATKIKGKGKWVKTTEISGSDPALILEVANDDYIKVSLNPHKDGWVWDQITKCNEKLN